MPYTSITHTANGRAAIAYARGNGGRGHNDNEVRNRMIVGVGMRPDETMSYEDQMAKDWVRASKKNKNQVRRIIGSFSKEELDPEDEMSIVTAANIGMAFVERNYPSHKAAIFVQTDGVGGLVHLHMIVNNVNTITWRGCTDEQCRASWVATQFDTVAAEYIDLSTGIGLNTPENKIGFEDTGVSDKKSTNPYIRKRREDGKYVWHDDLTERITDVVDHGTFRNHEEFVAELADIGVGAEYHETKKGHRYYTYELIDMNEFLSTGTPIPKNGTKAKSYKLGLFCDIDYIEQMMDSHKLDEKLKQEMVDHPERFEGGVRLTARELERDSDDDGYDYGGPYTFFDDLYEGTTDIYGDVVNEQDVDDEPALKVSYKKSPEPEDKPEPETEEVENEPVDEPVVIPEPVTVEQGGEEAAEEDDEDEVTELHVPRKWFSDDDLEQKRAKEQAKEELRIKLAARGIEVKRESLASAGTSAVEQRNADWISQLQTGANMELIADYDGPMAAMHEIEENEDDGDYDDWSL